MMETEVRVGRALTSSERTTRWVEKEVKCWRDTGSLGTGVDRTCDSCSPSVSNCPRAEYGTVIENGGASYLYIVQFAVYGIPVKGLSFSKKRRGERGTRSYATACLSPVYTHGTVDHS